LQIHKDSTFGNKFKVLEKLLGRKIDLNYLSLLKWACFFIFLGRAWQHIFWDAPFRTLLWDQNLMQGFIESLSGMTWEQYTTSSRVDAAIQFSIRTNGFFYLCCAIVSLVVKSNFKKIGVLLLVGATALLFLAFLDCKEKFFQLGEFLEHGLQIASPIVLYSLLFTNSSREKIVFFTKIAIACTFIGHGLYAVNYYPQPGVYADLVINIFHIDETMVKNMLAIFGYVDFTVALFIFIPRISLWALVYCGVWGLLTALARPIAGFDSNFILQTINQNGFEMLYRLANGFVPIWVFYFQSWTAKLFPSEIIEKRAFKNSISN